VHRLAPGAVPDTPPGAPTFLLVRRDATGDVHFSELSPLVFRLLELLAQSPSPTGHDALLMLANEANATDPEAFVHEGALMLQRLLEEDTILGLRPLM
jgi:hypothetical protein